MSQFKSRIPNGFTLIELLICVAIFGILASIIAGVLFGKNPYRMSDCVRSGGSWTEGYELGHYIGLCTYPSRWK
jgi:prepilin-type N-terminal cleavage/methylation domain-containing protein